MNEIQDTPVQQQTGEKTPNSNADQNKGKVAWVKRWGFSLLVLLAVAGAAWVAWKVKVPEQPPEIALKSPAVYRIEIGAAVFLGLYLVLMAVVLALHNRAFTEISLSGLKAQEIANRAQQDAIRGTGEEIEDLFQTLDEIQSAIGRSLGAINDDIGTLKKRLVEIEAREKPNSR